MTATRRRPRESGGNRPAGGPRCIQECDPGLGHGSTRPKRQRSLDQGPRPAKAVTDYRVKACRGCGAFDGDHPGRAAPSCPNGVSNNIGAQARALNDDREATWPGTWCKRFARKDVRVGNHHSSRTSRPGCEHGLPPVSGSGHDHHRAADVIRQCSADGKFGNSGNIGRQRREDPAASIHQAHRGAPSRSFAAAASARSMA